MNHIYKTVWNEQTGTYVAVSENTKRKGKSNALKSAVVVGSIVGALAMLASPAFADTGTGGGTGSGTAISHTNNGCGFGTSEAQANARDAIAIGCGSQADVNGQGTTFYNRGNPDNQDFSHDGKRNPTKFHSTAIGTNAKASSASVAIGHGADANVIDGGLAVAIGSQARAQNVAAVAIGPAALASGNTGLALGRQSSATKDFAQAIGNVARADGVGALAVGHSATAQGKRSIAIGAADIDNAGNTGTQQGTVYQEGEQTLATGRDSIALGAAANATSDFALSIGAHSTASGLNSTAMGYKASASGENSFASGASATASGLNAFALGAGSLGQGDRSFAMGPQSKAIGENALALGSLSVANQKNSIAVGVGAQANFADSVALGSYSKVDHANSLAIGTESTTNDYTTEEAFLYESGAAGAIATGAVSFGNGSGTTKDGAANERRLQNVAAGGLDTDAVNVSQLKLHKGITDKAGQTIADNLGGGSSFDPNTGVINAPTYNIGENYYNNVGDALTAARTVVAAGDNIKVDMSTGKGPTTFTVHTEDDLVLTSVTTGQTVMNNVGVKVGDNVNLGDTGLVITGGPSVTKDGISAGGKVISDVAAGVADSDAVNLAQLKEYSDGAGKGWNISANGGAAANVAPGAKVDFSNNDGNIVISQTGTDLAFNLGNELVIGGGQDGKDGTPGKIIIKDGIPGKDGAPGKDIDVGDMLSSGLTFAGDSGDNVNRLLGETLRVTGGATGELSDGNIGVVADGKDALVLKLAKDLTGLNSVTAGGTRISSNGLTFVDDAGELLANTPSVTKDGISAGGKVISDVAAGKADTDAVNVSQLKDVSDVANKGWNISANGGAAANVAPGAKVDFSNNDGNIVISQTGTDLAFNLGNELVIGGGQDGKDGTPGKIIIKDGIPGKDGAPGKDIDVGDMLSSGLTFAGDSGDNVNRLLGETLRVTGGATGELSDGNIGVVADGKDALVLKLAKDLTGLNSVTAGGTRISSNGLTFVDDAGELLANTPSVTTGGIDAGGQKITGVADGVADSDAVNVSQLKDVQENVDNLGDRAVTYDGAVGSPKDTITLAGGKDGTLITNLKDGKIEAGSKDAVNGGQIHNMGQSIAAGMGGNSTFTDGKLVTELNVAGNKYSNVNDALTGVHGDLSEQITNVENIANAGWNISANGEASENVKPGATVDFANTDNNIVITQSGTDLTFNLSDNIQVGDTITIGGDTNNQTVINQGGITTNTVTATSLNVGGGTMIVNDNSVTIAEGTTVNMGGNRITNVAPGVEGGDVVNMNQLNAVAGSVNNLSRDIRRVDREARAGTASAAAMANLPQAYLPGKSMFAVAGAGHRGESGYAAGLSTISDNGKWVIKGSVAGNSRGDVTYGAGVGYQW